MPYAIMRCQKLKTSSAAAGADIHNERERETLNADKRKKELNRTLINNAITFKQAAHAHALVHELSPAFGHPKSPATAASTAAQEKEHIEESKPEQYVDAPRRRVRLSRHAMLRDELSLMREAQAKSAREEAQKKRDEHRKRLAREREEKRKTDEQQRQAEGQKVSEVERRKLFEKEKQERREEREQERRYQWDREHKERAAGHDAARRRVEADYTPEEYADVIGRSYADKTPLTEQVDRIIARSGGKPRVDSVECVEFILSASPLFFEPDREGKPDPKVLEGWVDANMNWMDKHTEEGLVFVKATLHLDEYTPHIHAVAVPLDPDDKLNCKHHFGGDRTRLSQWQTNYHSYVELIGLERGYEGSRATHHEVQDFYATMRDKIEIEVAAERLPLITLREAATENGRKHYRERLIAEVIEQVEPGYETIRKQALLTNDEHARRVQAEQELTSSEVRLADATRDIEERIQSNVNEVLEDAQQIAAVKFQTIYEEGLREATESLVEDLNNQRQATLDFIGQFQDARDEAEHSERRAANLKDQNVTLNTEVAKLRTEVAVLAETNATLNNELKARTQMLTDTIGINRLLCDEGLLPRPGAQKGVTHYVIDPNQVWRDEGFELRPEALKPITQVYTLLHLTNEVFSKETGGCVGTTTFAVAHDYYTQKNWSESEHETRSLLGDKYGREAATGCYMAHHLQEASTTDQEMSGFEMDVTAPIKSQSLEM